MGKEEGAKDNVEKNIKKKDIEKEATNKETFENEKIKKTRDADKNKENQENKQNEKGENVKGAEEDEEEVLIIEHKKIVRNKGRRHGKSREEGELSGIDSDDVYNIDDWVSDSAEDENNQPIGPEPEVNSDAPAITNESRKRKEGPSDIDKNQDRRKRLSNNSMENSNVNGAKRTHTGEEKTDSEKKNRKNRNEEKDSISSGS